MVSQTARFSLFPCLILVLAGAFLPVPVVITDLSAALLHFGAFAILATLALLAFPRVHPLAICLVGNGLGASVEVLQETFGVGRSTQWQDVVANNLGVCVVCLIAILFRSRKPQCGKANEG